MAILQLPDQTAQCAFGSVQCELGGDGFTLPNEGFTDLLPERLDEGIAFLGTEQLPQGAVFAEMADQQLIEAATR